MTITHTAAHRLWHQVVLASRQLHPVAAHDAAINHVAQGKQHLAWLWWGRLVVALWPNEGQLHGAIAAAAAPRAQPLSAHCPTFDS